MTHTNIIMIFICRKECEEQMFEKPQNTTIESTIYVRTIKHMENNFIL